jgi:hypothetical protein
LFPGRTEEMEEMSKYISWELDLEEKLKTERGVTQRMKMSLQTKLCTEN